MPSSVGAPAPDAPAAAIEPARSATARHTPGAQRSAVRYYSLTGGERAASRYHEDRLPVLRNRERLELMVTFHGAVRDTTFYWGGGRSLRRAVSGHCEATVSQREKGTFECRRPGS